MQIELSNDEAKALKNHLAQRIDELDRELVRTDKHELQVALDQDIARLRAVDERLGRLVRSGG